jgi:hypothetical protein
VPPSVKIVAVSKTKPAGDILEAYKAGQKIFGENRVQELLAKKDQLPGDIEWHLVGHLQTNKVKYIASFISMIHSVDTLRLLRVIDAEGRAIKRKINCLLQVHIASEETKFGFTPEEAERALSPTDFQELGFVNVRGVMGMATFTGDEKKVREEFRFLAGFFRKLKTRYFAGNPDFTEISMGMSGDYRIAIEEGSTIIRIGNLVFGARK